jgi:hypothetical protein
MEVCTVLIYLTNLTVPFGTVVLFHFFSVLFHFLFFSLASDMMFPWLGHPTPRSSTSRSYMQCGMAKTGTWVCRVKCMLHSRSRPCAPRPAASATPGPWCSDIVSADAHRRSVRGITQLAAFAPFYQPKSLSHSCGLVGVVTVALVTVDLPAGIHSGGNFPTYKPPL